MIKAIEVDGAQIDFEAVDAVDAVGCAQLGATLAR